MKLRPFQREFERAVENPAYDTVCLTGPRGLGKTFIAGHVLARCMTPGDVLHQPGKEYILGAASLEQARMTYAFIRAALEHTGAYRWIDSTTRLGCTHKTSNTKLRAISSNAKTSFGLVNVPVAVIDEPGALEIVGGQMLADSLFTAQGKLGSRLKLILVGTLAPQATAAGHWWYDLVHGGTTRSTHVQHFRGELETWDKWPTIRKANPLIMLREAANTRRVVLEERDAARRDSRLRSRFLTYRLNLPTRDESEMLLTVEDWKLATARPVVAGEGGPPIVGIDLGGGRSWSAAIAIWSSGRVEGLAVAPGIPDLETQERRDTVPAGTYRRLYERGVLGLAEGLRVQPTVALWGAIRERWGVPVRITCDRFRLAELEDAIQGACIVEPRVTRWSEAAADIRALRRIVRDGPLTIEESTRPLLAASLSEAYVKNDETGNVRLAKRGSNNKARDDVAAALCLAAGAFDRTPARPRKAYHGLV